MRYYEFLAEETADDLYRKIAAFDAIISDNAATDGEKENAKSLKSKLLDKLKKEYPGAKPSWVTDIENSWFGQMAKATHDHMEREKEWKKDPSAKIRYYRNIIANLKRQRSNIAWRRGMGDVSAIEMYNDLSYEIDSIMSEHLPDDWDKLLAQREKSRQSGYKYQAKKQKEREDKLKAEINKQKEKEGLDNWKVIGKEYSEPLNRFYEKVKKLRIPKWPSSTFGSIYKSKDMLSGLTAMGTGDIRNNWIELSPEDQIKVKEAVSKVNTLGYNADGYTYAQKERILDAMRPSKAPPSRNPDSQKNHYQKYLNQRAADIKKRRGY